MEKTDSIKNYFTDSVKSDIAFIERLVMNKFGISRDDLYSRDRRLPRPYARFFAYYVLNGRFGWTTIKIAAHFMVDHTTVVHGIQRVKSKGWDIEIDEILKLMDSNPQNPQD